MGRNNDCSKAKSLLTSILDTKVIEKVPVGTYIRETIRFLDKTVRSTIRRKASEGSKIYFRGCLKVLARVWGEGS